MTNQIFYDHLAIIKWVIIAQSIPLGPIPLGLVAIDDRRYLLLSLTYNFRSFGRNING